MLYFSGRNLAAQQSTGSAHHLYILCTKSLRDYYQYLYFALSHYQHLPAILSFHMFPLILIGTRSEYSIASVDASPKLNSLSSSINRRQGQFQQVSHPIQRTSKIQKGNIQTMRGRSTAPNYCYPLRLEYCTLSQTALHLAGQGNGISCIGINQEDIGYHCAKHGQPLILGVKLHFF